LKRTLALPILVVLMLAAVPARAAIQTRGPELFPGKLQLGVTVIGFQAGFVSLASSGYKLTADFSGLIAPIKPGGIWLGGGMNYTAGFFGCTAFNGCGGDLQLWAFVMLTLEKIIPIPLVPFVRAGIGGDVEFYNGAVGAFVLRFGGGVHYYLLKWLGVGIETNFTLGPGFYGNNNGVNGTGFYGTWDFGMGARFAF
jgi:hypothetical protein